MGGGWWVVGLAKLQGCATFWMKYSRELFLLNIFVRAMSMHYHFGFDRLPALKGSGVLENVQKPGKKVLESEFPELKSLRFPNFISLQDIVPVSGFDTVNLHGTEAEENTNGYTHHSGAHFGLEDEENYEFKHFISMNLFHDETDPTKNALTVVLEGLSSDITRSDSLIDQLLSYTMNDIVGKVSVKVEGIDVKINTKFSWTALVHELVEPKMVFIEFSDLLALDLFQRLLEEGSLKLRMKSVTKQACQKLEEKVEIGSISKELFLEKLRQVEHTGANLRSGKSHKNGSSEEYVVDSKEMEDIPSDMLNLVKQNVVDFRMRVLRLETQKKEQQILRGKQNSKTKLRRMYFPGQGDRMDEDGDEDEEDLEGDGVDDLEFKKQQEAQAHARAEKTYLMRVQQTRARDDARHKRVDQFNKTIEHHAYETEYVAAARKRFLDSFVTGIKDNSNKIDLNFSYYINHSNYLAFRSKKKSDEERLDAQDREEDAAERDLNAEQNEFMASFGDKPVKITLKKDEDAALSPELVGKLREAAEEVLEEFLGVKEESLVEFMVSFVSKNRIADKTNAEYSAFVSELAETLDEDAQAAVDRLYAALT
ncbi:hypothetical protein OGAPHI_002679 [Ogataea philodendri]|uniref:Uncharacterized protein n=1 Tax=Ogataea philodendri TaxID=1378263 RepID=A0A9P8PCU7_9ASCO|nr:uncharacterized protein OGAPHI_002679 [Ogataea philodendri]KAH3668924.1 hypothetical protein OGAPHI_002679 [Ogataea philodendri]